LAGVSFYLSIWRFDRRVAVPCCRGPPFLKICFSFFRNGGNEMRFDQVAFGCRLKEIRKERGLTQEQLAAVVNMSTVHLGNIELGKRGISIDLLLELSDALNVSIDFLVRGRAYESIQAGQLISNIRELLDEIEALTQNPS